MQENCLTRLPQHAAAVDGLELCIPQPKAGTAAYAIFRRENGELFDRRISAAEVAPSAADGDLLGYLWLSAGDGALAGTCVFVTHHPRMVINGLTPPLPAVTLDPGTLLAIDGEFWHFAIRWTPEVSQPPERLRQKPCPVCGCPLEAAPAVQCLCGRWTHLQNPNQPDDPEALNCFLHVEKCLCQRRPSLQPLTEPELPESLAASAPWNEF